MSYLDKKRFADIDLDDPFFDTLKADYATGFEAWYQRKTAEGAEAIVLYDNGDLLAFLYMKVENGIVDDVTPPLPAKRRLKVGTFKVEAHGTKLGERFIKRIFDTAIKMGIDEIYLTIFEKHTSLIGIFQQFGFETYGYKETQNGRELVLLKQFGNFQNNMLKDYPIVDMRMGNSYLLSIYPEYHTRLFSDSILRNESVEILQDRSHTNSIHKIYLTAMRGTENLQHGDKILIYRTNDGQGPAHYRSVATSLCIVEETVNINSFANLDDFERYCAPYSIFSHAELEHFYLSKKYPFIIKMTYNIAFNKRVTRGEMLDELGIRSDYWGFFPLPQDDLLNIIDRGGVDESLIVY